MTDFGFAASFNMGYEGFSKPLALSRQTPVWGNRGEFLFLALVFLTLPCFVKARKSHEDALRAEVKATNRYAPLHLNKELREPTRWTL